MICRTESAGIIDLLTRGCLRSARMSEARAETRRGALGWVRRLDDAVFAIEQAVVAVALLIITVVIFIDVVARRANAPDSKVGQLIARIAGIEDYAAREALDANVAPYVTVGFSFVLLFFGAYTARRFIRRRKAAKGETVPKPKIAVEAGISAAIAVVGIGVGYLITLPFANLEWSWIVYAVLFGVSAAAYAGYLLMNRPEGWMLEAIIAIAVGAVLIWVASEFLPIGYTWSKKISLQLLLWVGLLSASICVHEGKHIRLEAAAKIIPDGAKPYVLAVGAFATAVFCGIMTYLGFLYVFAPTASDDEFMTELFTWGGTRYVYGFEGSVGRGGLLEGTDIPDWLGILAAPVGFGVATLRFVGAGVSVLLGGDYGTPPPQEGLEEAQKLAMKTGATSDLATSATKDATTAELDEAIEAKRSSGEEE